MTWRAAPSYALMWAIRYTPLPWRLKRKVLHLAAPKTAVVGIALIVDASGQILQLRSRYSGYWQFPGGHISPGEDPATGTRRECREELGCEVIIERFIGLHALDSQGELIVAFQCAPLTASPRLSAEHEAFRYIPVDRLEGWMRTVADDGLGTASPG